MLELLEATFEDKFAAGNNPVFNVEPSRCNPVSYIDCTNSRVRNHKADHGLGYFPQAETLF